jgi:hypothetical protein
VAHTDLFGDKSAATTVAHRSRLLVACRELSLAKLKFDTVVRSRPDALLLATMTAPETPLAEMPAAVRVPQHVVYRDFAAETVVLNLNTGIYHGLNPTAGRMLTVLDEHGDIGAAAGQLSNEYRRPRAQIAADLETLCRELLARGLIEACPSEP